MAMQFIYNGITQFEEPGLIITFEEFPQQYYHDAMQFGWDFKKLEAKGQLKIVFSDPETTLKELENVDGTFISIIEKMKIKRVVVDSVTHFESLSLDEFHLREIERKFINALKRENVTSILFRENDSLMGQMGRVTSKIPFIVDSYFLLRYVEIDSTIQKAFLILKMRGSDHQKDIRCFRIRAQGHRGGGQIFGTGRHHERHFSPFAARRICKRFRKKIMNVTLLLEPAVSCWRDISLRSCA